MKTLEETIKLVKNIESNKARKEALKEVSREDKLISIVKDIKLTSEIEKNILLNALIRIEKSINSLIGNALSGIEKNMNAVSENMPKPVVHWKFTIHRDNDNLITTIEAKKG